MDVTENPPPIEHATLTMETTATPATQPAWLSTHIRNMMILMLGMAACYIAIVLKNEHAQEIIVGAFIMLVAGKAASSDALKMPGKDG